MIGKTFGPNRASSSSKVWKSQSAFGLLAAKPHSNGRSAYLIDLELLSDNLHQLLPLCLTEQHSFLRQSEEKADVFRHELDQKVSTNRLRDWVMEDVQSDKRSGYHTELSH